MVVLLFLSKKVNSEADFLINLTYKGGWVGGGPSPTLYLNNNLLPDFHLLPTDEIFSKFHPP